MKKRIMLLLASIVLFMMFGNTIIANANEKHSNSEYKKYGITVENKIYYYNNKRIRIFQDMKSDKSFVNSFVDEKGMIDICILRNNNDKIKKVKYISKRKAKKILKDLLD